MARHHVAPRPGPMISPLSAPVDLEQFLYPLSAAEASRSMPRDSQHKLQMQLAKDMQQREEHSDSILIVQN